MGKANLPQWPLAYLNQIGCIGIGRHAFLQYVWSNVEIASPLHSLSTEQIHVKSSTLHISSLKILFNSIFTYWILIKLLLMGVSVLLLFVFNGLLKLPTGRLTHRGLSLCSQNSLFSGALCMSVCEKWSQETRDNFPPSLSLSNSLQPALKITISVHFAVCSATNYLGLTLSFTDSLMALKAERPVLSVVKATHCLCS